MRRALKLMRRHAQHYAELRQAIDALWLNRRLRGAHPEEFAAFREAVRGLRDAFAAADWPTFERRFDKFWLAVQDLREAFLLPRARLRLRPAAVAQPAAEAPKEQLDGEPKPGLPSEEGKPPDSGGEGSAG